MLADMLGRWDKRLTRLTTSQPVIMQASAGRHTSTHIHLLAGRLTS